MTDPVAITIVMAVQGVIVASINAIVAARNHAETKQDIASVSGKVDATHSEINGRMTELLVAAKAQGAEAQRKETREDEARK